MLKWVEIDLGILKNNVRIIKKSLSAGVRLMAVVKADAYGHGAAAVSRIALDNGADCLGVLTSEEGEKLRSMFPGTEIHLLAPSLPEEAERICANGLVSRAESAEFLAALDGEAALCRKRLSYYLEIDTGLGRWGVKPDKAAELLVYAAGKFKNLIPAGITTHLSYRPPQNMTEAEEKMNAFSALAASLKRRTGLALAVSAANSSVLCDFPHRQFDMVRTGNLMYGIYPTDIYKKRRNGPPLPGLRRPWQFYAKIISVNDISQGQTLGYAGEITAFRNMRTASLAVGYSDGLSLEPAENAIHITSGFKYWAVINGKKAYYVGKPGISHTLLDITDIPEASVGTVVALHIRRTAANANIPRIYTGI